MAPWPGQHHNVTSHISQTNRDCLCRETQSQSVRLSDKHLLPQMLNWPCCLLQLEASNDTNVSQEDKDHTDNLLTSHWTFAGGGRVLAVCLYN